MGLGGLCCPCLNVAGLASPLGAVKPLWGLGPGCRQGLEQDIPHILFTAKGQNYFVKCPGG